MNTETALPTAEQAQAGGQQETADQLDTSNEQQDNEHGADASQDESEEGAKKEKTPEERERARMQRAIDRKTRQLAQERAERAQERAELERLRSGGSAVKLPNQESDDEPVSLSRAELAELVKSEAQKLAPTLKQEQAEIEHRKTVVESLAKTWGQERFDAIASDLDEALGGLTDRSGKPKPATDAIFQADDPKAVIEYLADPENEAEAESIGRMGPLQAGRAIAKLEVKLAGTKAANKPQRSNAPEPIEPARGRGTATDMPDPADTKAYIKWANEQERKR